MKIASNMLSTLIYGGIGLRDQAFVWLEKAYEVRDDWMMALKVDPRFDTLRQDPRLPPGRLMHDVRRLPQSLL